MSTKITLVDDKLLLRIKKDYWFGFHSTEFQYLDGTKMFFFSWLGVSILDRYTKPGCKSKNVFFDLY